MSSLKEVVDSCTMLTVSLALSLLITSVSDLIALCELPHDNRRNRHIKRASNMCRLTQLITLANIRDIIYTVVHPAPFELVICRAFPAYILDEIKPCNLDLIKQFTRLGKKAYPVLCSSPEKAIATADGYIAAGHVPDIVFFDLPGTVNSEGVINSLAGMLYISTYVKRFYNHLGTFKQISTCKRFDR